MPAASGQRALGINQRYATTPNPNSAPVAVLSNGPCGSQWNPNGTICRRNIPCSHFERVLDCAPQIKCSTNASAAPTYSPVHRWQHGNASPPGAQRCSGFWAQTSAKAWASQSFTASFERMAFLGQRQRHFADDVRRFAHVDQIQRAAGLGLLALLHFPEQVGAAQRDGVSVV